MLEQVENKIIELKQQQKDEYYKKKDEDLLSWGLTGTKKGKKSVPLIVTDDEYEALVEASSGLKASSRNRIAAILNVASIGAVALGIIIGIVCFKFAAELNFVYFSVCLIVSVLLALVLKGLSEAVRLLQQLVDEKRVEDFKKNKKNTGNAYAAPQKAAPAQPAVPPIQFAYSDSFVAFDPTAADQ